MLRKLTSLTLLAALLAPAVNARPVSYPEAWTLMIRNDADINSLHIHYTPDTQHSIGLRLRYDRDAEALFTGGQINRLIKRWNEVDSQANFYGRIGVGRVTDQSSLGRDDEWGLFAGLSADWETRRYFISGAVEHWAQGEFGDKSSAHGRLGIAPYVANTGALHTWIMVEGHYRPDEADDEDVYGATALLRFFKGPSLLEIGVDNKGEPVANYIHRF